MRRSLQSAVFFLCVAASAAGMYNVMSDNAEVERLAKQVACADEKPAGGTAPRPAGQPSCEDAAQRTFMEKGPIGQTFDIVTPKRKVSVRCTRAFVLVGDYTCAMR
jgi:hypothetical protein